MTYNNDNRDWRDKEISRLKGQVTLWWVVFVLYMMFKIAFY